MKTFLAVLFTMVIVSSLSAQETKIDAATSRPILAAPATMLLEPVSPQPLTLIPDLSPPIPKPQSPSSEQPRDSQPSMSEAKETLQKARAAAEANHLKERILFRQVKTRSIQDPKVQEQWAVIGLAKTPQEKKEALKRYYTLLYEKMLGMDESLRDCIEKRKQESLEQLDKITEVTLNPALHESIW